MPIRIVALALALLLPHVAHAAALAPAKASDLVAVYTKGNGDCPVAGRPFDTRVMPDGTEVPFVIPPKKVFVITSLQFTFESSSPPNNHATPTVSLQLPGAVTGVPLVIGAAVTDADGGASGSVVVPNGVTVRSGTICFAVGTTQSAILHGFFAKDK
jgi:hypothetical protein